MKLSLAEATVIRKTVAGIPEIAQTISETAKNHRKSSLERVEQDYFQRMLQAGFEEMAARRWILFLSCRNSGWTFENGLT
jgi:hypothetical protein